MDDLKAPNDEGLHNYLKRIRKESGLTQTELGVEIDISRETISAIENGGRAPLENMSNPKIRRWKEACYKSARQNKKSLIEKLYEDLKRHLINLL